MKDPLGRHHEAFGEKYSPEAMLPADREAAAFLTGGPRPDVAGLIRHHETKFRLHVVSLPAEGPAKVETTGGLARRLYRISRSVRLEAERAIEAALAELAAELESLSAGAHDLGHKLAWRAELVCSFLEVRRRLRGLVLGVVERAARMIRAWRDAAPWTLPDFVTTAGGWHGDYAPLA